MTVEHFSFKVRKPPKGKIMPKIPNDMGLREDDTATEKLLVSDEQKSPSLSTTTMWFTRMR